MAQDRKPEETEKHTKKLKLIDFIEIILLTGAMVCLAAVGARLTQYRETTSYYAALQENAMAPQSDIVSLERERSKPRTVTETKDRDPLAPVGAATLLIGDDGDEEVPVKEDVKADVKKDAGEEEKPVEVDFDLLLEENGDTVAWLRMPAAGIDLPVVQAADNDYYLRRAFDGTDSQAGSIYLECVNDPELTDMHSLIYGHNMRDGSMFGALEETLSRGKLSPEDLTFEIFLPSGKVMSYRIYAAYATTDESLTYTVFDTPEAWEIYVDRAREASLKSIDADPKDNSRLLTLSTCSGPAGGTKRFVAEGFLVSERKVRKP